MHFFDTDVDNAGPEVRPGDLESLVRYLAWAGMPDYDQHVFVEKVRGIPKASWRASLTEWVQLLATTGLAATQVEHVAAAVSRFLR